MDYQKSYVLMWVGMIVGIILVAVGAGLEIGWLLGIGFVIFAAALLQTWLFYGCSSAAPTAANSGIPAAAFPTTARSAGSTSGKMFP